jgi:biopolymer transport protein ExbB
MEGMDVSHFTIQGMWAQMGFIAKAVVVILLLMSIYSLGFAIERLIRFRRARKESLKVAIGVQPLLKQRKLEEAITFTKKKDFRHSHLARVLAAGLTEFQYENSQELPPDFDIVDSGKRAIERETMMTTAELKKGLGNLATISTTAPFIGLFGTVVGIINSFRGMAASGSGGIGAVSAGIAEALFATAIGLAVAIPSVWLYNYFTNKVDRFNVEMSNASSELVDYFLKNRRAPAVR